MAWQARLGRDGKGEVGRGNAGEVCKDAARPGMAWTGEAGVARLG